MPIGAEAPVDTKLALETTTYEDICLSGHTSHDHRSIVNSLAIGCPIRDPFAQLQNV